MLAAENKVQTNLDFQVRLVTIHVAGGDCREAAILAGFRHIKIMAG